MVSFSPEDKSLANVKAVPMDSTSQGELAGLIDNLLGALSELHAQNWELEQLWLEAHWLQEDLQQGVLAVPGNWELLLFEVARGGRKELAKQYPDIAREVRELCDRISSQLATRGS